MSRSFRAVLLLLLLLALAAGSLALVRPEPADDAAIAPAPARRQTWMPLRPFAETPSVPAEPGQPPASRLVPGREVTVELSEPPAERYLAAVAGENDRFYRRLVLESSRGQDVVPDADLGRAAREFVFQYTEFGDEPPSDVRDFLIRGSGAVAGDTVFQHLRTTSEAESALRKALASVLDQPPSGTGPLHVGVGEVFTPGARYSRHIGIIATRLPIALEPAPRRAEPGTTWTLAGRLRVPYTDLKALVMHPDLRLETLEPTLDGDRLRLDVALGAQAGPVDVQLLGTGPDGPGKLVQLRVEVGTGLPRRYTTRLAPDERRLDTADAAAAYAFELVNADRARHGLPALRWDAELARLARDHSADMRDHGFFSHVSPTGGLHTDRLARAGYRAVTSAENLAHNASIFEAQAGLMHSLGHRRNLLEPGVTHLGVGVAGQEDEDGQRRWWVTQLFARPVERVDVRAESDRLVTAINDSRQQDRAGALQADAALGEVALEAARAVLAGQIEGASGQALDAAKQRGLLRGKLRAWAALLPELKQLELPAMIGAAEARRLGVGILQDETGLDGRVAVVLLVGD